MQKPNSLLSSAGENVDKLQDAGTGVLKGAGHTANTVGKLLLPDKAVTAMGMTAPSEAQQSKYFTPTNTPQKVGYGVEQAGEYLAPTGLEEGAANIGGKLLGGAGKVAGKLLGAAAHSGTVNSAQGGDFSTGAAAGAVGSGIGQAAKMVAPVLAETALKVRGTDRAYGATPGRFILDETKGFSPRKVIDSGRKSLTGIQAEQQALTGAAGNAGVKVDLFPARKILSDAVDKAEQENHPGTTKDIEKLATQLDKWHSSGQPIPPLVRPNEAMGLNRGLTNAVTSFNPATLNDSVSAAGKMAHHSLGESVTSVIPEMKPLNQRVQSAIPVLQRANMADLNAGAVQRTLDRMRAHTGALIPAVAGGGYGYERGGVPGMLLGGVAGLAAPELMSSPETQMLGARAFNSPALTKAVIPAAQGALLQKDRKK